MIECLKIVLYNSVWYYKIIIVVIYSFYFIDFFIVYKVYVFVWNWIYDFYVCFVLNIVKNLEFFRVVDIEILWILLFVIKVILVEGVSDREVL